MSDGFHTPSPMSSPVSPAHSTHTTDSGSEYYSVTRKNTGQYTLLTSSSQLNHSGLSEEHAGNTTTAHITLLSSTGVNDVSLLSGISSVSATTQYHHHHHLKQEYHQLTAEPSTESQYPIQLHTLVDPETGDRYLTSSSTVAAVMQNLNQGQAAQVLDFNSSGNGQATVILEPSVNLSGENVNTNMSLVAEGAPLVLPVAAANEVDRKFTTLGAADHLECIDENVHTACSSPVSSVQLSSAVLSPPPTSKKTNSKKEAKEKKGRGGRKSNKEKQEGKTQKMKKEKEPKEKKKRSNRQVYYLIFHEFDLSGILIFPLQL